MWQYRLETLQSQHTQKITLLSNNQKLTYAEVIELWENNPDFRLFFTNLLASATFSAYFWETPPITLSNIDREFEFVLIDSPSLAKVNSNPNAFREYFSSTLSEAVITFTNLGGDALLVVPCPVGDNDIYPHLATFVRKALDAQCHALWQTLGQAIKQRLNNQPLWVSTSGLGVYWLHIRLDSYPKYYQFRPYRFF